jgi:DNA repair protein RadC
MLPAPVPFAAIIEDVRQRAEPAGALLGIFLNAEHGTLLTMRISEGTDHVDELFLRHLVGVVADMQMVAVIFAVMRVEGRPARIDRLLWRELYERLENEPTRFLDVIVIGAKRSWSCASGRRIPAAGA